jgi:hypothetical protein
MKKVLSEAITILKDLLMSYLFVVVLLFIELEKEQKR